jgi:hypothetical protein
MNFDCIVVPEDYEIVQDFFDQAENQVLGYYPF